MYSMYHQCFEHLQNQFTKVFSYIHQCCSSQNDDNPSPLEAILHYLNLKLRYSFTVSSVQLQQIRN